ncbi:MAG TPA: hypothetical protein DDW85_02400 [Porphyromonadaceae bacterium]|nr:hypothetical protein [Porphyromonadaceae bacterium]
MKKIEFKKINGEFPDYLRALSALEEYFGFPYVRGEAGKVSFYNNANFYTPIRVEECSENEADFLVCDEEGSVRFYFKRI